MNLLSLKRAVCVCVCVCACVRACVHVYIRTCMLAYVCVHHPSATQGVYDSDSLST